MKYIKTFEQFINEEYSYNEVSEANKWTKDAYKKLYRFAKKFPKMVEGEYDPKTARISSAILNIFSVSDTLTLFGAEVWQLNNLDKTKIIAKIPGGEWEDSDDKEGAEKYIAFTKKYIDLEKSVFELGLKAISAIEKGNGNLESIISNIESTSDKAYKMNRKWQKLNSAGGTIGTKDEFEDERWKAKWDFHNDLIQKAINSTSNKKAIDGLKDKIKNP